MIDQSALNLLLQCYPMLETLSAEEITNLTHHSTLIQAEKGRILFDEDQICQGFPLLISGCIKVVKAAANGRELQLYRVHPGESCILTSSCLIGNSVYHARGVVEQKVDAVFIPAAIFKKLIVHSDAFRQHVFGLFSERLTELMQLVSAVAFQKLDQRLAKTLAFKASPVQVTHQQLAEELGTVRELVSRLLKNFADLGWVALGREQINIIDAEALKKYSEQ